MDKITTKAFIVFLLLIIFLLVFAIFSKTHAQDEGLFISNAWTVGNEIVVIEYQDEQGNTHIQARNRNSQKRQNSESSPLENDYRKAGVQHNQDESGTLESFQEQASDLTKDSRWQNCQAGSCEAEDSIHDLLNDLASRDIEDTLHIYTQLIAYEIKQPKVRSITFELTCFGNYLEKKTTRSEKVLALNFLKYLQQEKWETMYGDTDAIRLLIYKLESLINK